MLKHLTISIYGKVQGVFFRRTVKHEARRRGIAGFVQNEPDGSVRIEAEGDEEILKEFVGWLKSGAGEGDYHITQVDTEEGPFKAYDRFEVRET